MKGKRDEIVYYVYDQEHDFLEVSFDESRNVLQIRGGKNGFAHLSETLAGFAQMRQRFEDECWYNLKPGECEFTVCCGLEYGK